ncbi:TKL protein kinase [Saprolegnia parasitica CBS 223.65]|uniref:TKL protein kinase n=1 Tax=Saprolegnia parasitica (strain CBS 223.65) TaxID=695850 RepID=A0A067BZK8_SAPPC|nr:TKL protein kinase [Saprolegnia parasitica CBS 223.65]KDO19726.1 TKL protein kinase [Saprolegnia parasitica CBS 223.65]|eukprot:XP_012209585.1 TKL protein kinase [Saprolegnia parasitica CBS 223.65]
MATTWLESADLVAKIHAIKAANVSDANMWNPETAPPSVASRLAALSLNWADLGNADKQALLWDMGLVRTTTAENNQVTQVYTKCSDSGGGDSMATIALSKAAFLQSQADATVRTCTSSTINTTYVRQENSNGGKLAPYTKCMIANVTGVADSHSSMWAQDGQGLSTYPVPNIMRHAWSASDSWLIYAIHTQTAGDEIGFGFCGPSSTPGGLTIPCQVFDGSGPPQGWCLPTPSARMTQSLARIALAKPSTSMPAPTLAPTDGSSNHTVLIVCLVAGAILVALGAWCCIRRRRKPTTTHGDFTAYRSNPPRGATSSPPTSYQPITTASHTLNEFQRDPSLSQKRLPYSSVVCSRLLSKGAFGEVWLGSFNGQVVAVKRLLDSKRTSEAEIEAFADEIRLMASFTHPNIVRFVGFAWDSLQNLCAVTEYMPQGDLHTYLQSHLQLQWRRHEKIKIALGIAHALAYLHSLSPAIIHRDLKSKNVLMAAGCEAKLSDFGISRERTLDETMTAGVGTIFWTAPEVLLGEHYSEMADIYSFGVVLCEIDTREAPYPNMKAVPQVTMVHRITNEGLRPAFSEACPAQLQTIASRCLDADPTMRPSARELVTILSEWR